MAFRFAVLTSHGVLTVNSTQIVNNFKDFADRHSVSLKTATNKNHYLAQLDGAESFAVHLLSLSHDACNVHIGEIWKHAAKVRSASFGSPALTPHEQPKEGR
jgi:hypothetical protein